MQTAKLIVAVLTTEERRRAAVLFVLLVVGAACEALGIALVLPVVAVLTVADVGSAYPFAAPWLVAVGEPTRSQLITGVVAALVAAALLRTTVLAIVVVRQTGFARDVEIALSQRLFTAYMRQPYTFHLQHNSAQLISTVSREVEQYGEALRGALTLLTEALALIAIGALLLTIEPLGVAIVVFLLGGAGLVFHLATRRRMTRWGEAFQYHERQRIQHLQQGLGAAKDVKLLGREQMFLRRFRVHHERSARLEQRRRILQQLPRLWLELLAVAGLASMVLAMLWRGRDPSTVAAALSMFVAAAFRLIPSVNRVLAALQAVQYARASVQTISRDVALQVYPWATVGSPVTLHSHLLLECVSYVYPTGVGPALERVSLRINRGESIGVVGTSGAGKTTLVDVILGLLTPTEGRVTVDGMDIRGHLRAWQDQIGYVSQAIYLTDDTIRRNVAFGVPDDEIDEAAVQRVVCCAGLDELAVRLPEGLDTLVGEDGVRLSGGERQRIGIARALYHSPSVLILDEATSALDTATEQEVMQAVRALRGEKTLIVVAHRLSTVGCCDRLFRVEGGTVVEEVGIRRPVVWNEPAPSEQAGRM